MKNFKILKLSSGFSFVEILMALSILGIGILAFVNLTQKTTNDNRSADLNSVKLQFFNSFRQFLNSSVGCGEIKNTPSTITPTWSPLSLNAFQAGSKFKYFSIKEISAKIIDSSKLILAGGSVQTSLEVKLVLEVFRDLKKNASVGSDGKTDEVFYFSMPVILSSAGKVLHCDLESAAGMACEGVGGSLGLDNKCKPSTSCKITGSYTSPTSYPLLPTGVLHENDVTNSAGCPPGSKTVRTGSFLYQQRNTGSGKKSGSGPPNYQQITFYTCIDCQPVGAVTGGTIGGGGGCFVAGTEITLLDGSKKNIEDIGLGESLIDLKGSKVKVQKLISYDYEGPIYSINGGPYFFTPNHPFLSTSGWKSLDPKKSMEEAPGLKVTHLMLGDILLKKDGVEVVLSLDSMNIKDKVYNFTLDGTHEYIANDYAVHNKLPVYDPNNGGAVLDPLLPSM